MNGKAAVYLGEKFLIRKMEGARTKIGQSVSGTWGEDGVQGKGVVSGKVGQPA
jgi:hypothetical protein